ncbi:MAG: rhomboid family intramembrane serine protease [Opitutaceae bacterium]
MIYDRPYMRNDFGRREASILGWIIGISVAVFVAQNVFEVWFKSPVMTRYLALSPRNIEDGFFWTVLTYGFLHGNIVHILFNLLFAFFLGRELLPLLGPSRFVGLYLASILVGGLSWLSISFTHTDGILLGASAAVFGLLTVFACFFPNKPITFLLFFIVPITVKPKHLILFFLAVAVFGLLFLELQGGGGVAHSAHLGGMLTGWLYFRYVHQRTEVRGSTHPRVELPKWFRTKKTTPIKTKYQVNLSKPDDVRAEVDRILDKINHSGFGTLTDYEKKVLDEARDILNRR